MTEKNMMVGDIVASDFRTAELFKKVNIDFCCGGQMSLEDSCEVTGADLEKLIQEIQMLGDNPVNSGNNYQDWKLDFLCDYIINNHHTYVKKTLPELYEYTNKIADVHGDDHPELIELSNLFSQLKDELTQHLAKEEEVLFPAIKDAISTNSEESKLIIVSEIDRMNSEHEFAGTTMATINHITNGYELPEGACQTYSVCFQMLAQFESDLHMHVHLENNILFKKALAL